MAFAELGYEAWKSISPEAILNSDPVWDNVMWWRQLTNRCEILKYNAWYSVFIYVGKSAFLVAMNRSRMRLQQHVYLQCPPLPKISQLTSSSGVVFKVTPQQSGTSGLCHGKDKRVLSSPNRPDWLRDPPDLLSSGYRGYALGAKLSERGVDHSRPSSV